MEQEKRILVIAPHADDEVLGCGGYLLHQKNADNADIRIIVATIGGSDKRQDFSTREMEFLNVCNALGAKGKYLYKNMDALIDTVSSFEIVSKLDKEIDDFKPDEIFVNCMSKHQDHIKLFQCAMSSIRLREGYMPKFVALYEYPFSTQGYNVHSGGKVYHDISDNIDDKIKLFKLYETQIRNSPSPLNERGIKALASIRGLESGVMYAEMFYLQQMKI